MNSLLLVIVLSMGSALAFAVSTALKHTSASQVPPAFAGGDRSLARFVRATLVHPLWCKGIAVDAVGFTLQAVALHVGALAVVQPLLLAGLVFALLFRSRTPGAVRPRELGCAAVLVATVIGLLALAGTTQSAHTAVGAVPVLLAGAVGVFIVAVSVVFGRRHRDHRLAGPVLGVAVAIAYAGAAALLKSVTNQIARDPTSVLSSWQLYALLAVAATGLLLNQVALQIGRLALTLPTISALDPIVSVALGVLIYHEHLQLGAGRGCALVVLLTLLGAVVLRLAAETPESQDAQQPGPPRVDAGLAGSGQRLPQQREAHRARLPSDLIHKASRPGRHGRSRDPAVKASLRETWEP